MQNLYQHIGDSHLLLSFVSNFTRAKFEVILELVKESVNKPEIPYILQTRIYAVSVECLDNILKYINSVKQDNLPDKFKSKLFVISESEDCYTIRTGSYVLNDQKEVLNKQINKINTLSQAELKKLYIKTLLSAGPEGGGVGIIEMAVKSNNNISYFFFEETENISLFTFETKIEKIKKNEELSH
jgi:hypothetical protein